MYASPCIAAPLTRREVEVINLLAHGCSYSQVGERLGVSPHTVTSHIKNAYRKLDVHSAAAAVMRALQLRLIGESLGSPDHGMGSALMLAYDGSRGGS